MDQNFPVDLNAIAVPPLWAGQTKVLADGRRVWACMACQTPDLCAADGICQRSLPR